MRFSKVRNSCRVRTSCSPNQLLRIDRRGGGRRCCRERRGGRHSAEGRALFEHSQHFLESFQVCRFDVHELNPQAEVRQYRSHLPLDADFALRYQQDQCELGIQRDRGQGFE